MNSSATRLWSLSEQERRALFPELSLFLASEACCQKFLQVFDGGEQLIGTRQHPAAYLLYCNRRDEIRGYAFTMGHGEFGRIPATVCIFRRPKTDYVVCFVLDKIEIKSYDLADAAAEAVKIGGLPFAKVSGFFFGEILQLVFCGIVHTMAQLVPQKGRQLAPPEFTAVFGEFDRTTKISEHKVGRQTLACERRVSQSPRETLTPTCVFDVSVLDTALLHTLTSPRPLPKLELRS